MAAGSKNVEKESHHKIRFNFYQEEIMKSNLLIKSLIQDIRECDGPESRLEKLNFDVKMAVKHMKENIEKLESTAKEEDKESDKSMLLQEVNQYNGELTTNFAELRKANFTSQMLINKKNQEILFGSNETELKKRKKNGKGGVIKLSSGITDSLQSLSQTMAAQVAQSEQAMQTLVGTSTTIEETHQEFHGMAGVIYQSRKLLSKYNRREITDKVVIFLAIAFFFACVLYVITKRVF